MEQPTDLSGKSIEELKAMAYDQIVILNQAQTNLGVLNETIAQLAQNPPAVEILEPEVAEETSEETTE